MLPLVLAFCLNVSKYFQSLDQRIEDIELISLEKIQHIESRPIKSLILPTSFNMMSHQEMMAHNNTIFQSNLMKYMLTISGLNFSLHQILFLIKSLFLIKGKVPTKTFNSPKRLNIQASRTTSPLYLAGTAKTANFYQALKERWQQFVDTLQKEYRKLEVKLNVDEPHIDSQTTEMDKIVSYVYRQKKTVNCQQEPDSIINCIDQQMELIVNVSVDVFDNFKNTYHDFTRNWQNTFTYDWQNTCTQMEELYENTINSSICTYNDFTHNWQNTCTQMEELYENTINSSLSFINDTLKNLNFK